MRIESQLLMNPERQVANTTNQISTFDDLLKRKEDDFYWQHQSQLQHSDLSFKPQNNSSNSQSLINQVAVNHDVTAQPIVEKSTEFTATPIIIQLEKTTPESITLSKEMVIQLITQIKTITEPANSLCEVIDLRPAVVQNVQASAPQQTIALLPNQPYKNYQLFISSEQVELTLNTTLFSKQQINDLHHLIRQWLAQKGYTLKQLMINGVPQ